MSHINKSCQWVLSISQVTHEWALLAMFRLNESCHTHMNDSCQWVILLSHVNESYQRVMSHMSERSWRCSGWMSHVTHTWMFRVNESYQWVMSMSHINESCHTWVSALGDVQVEWVMSHTHEWVTSHTWVSPVTCVNELFKPTWVRLHTQNEAFTRMTESCHTWGSTLGDIQVK